MISNAEQAFKLHIFEGKYKLVEPTINCTKCKRPVLEHQTDANKGVSYCYGCNLHFLVESEIERKRDEIIIPNRTSYLRLRIERDSLHIQIKWFGNYSIRQIIRDLMTENPRFLFSMIAFFVNRTTVSVNRGTLTIQHKPIDVLPFVHYRASYVKQFYVKQKDRVLDTYGLYVRLRNGREEMLIWDLDKQVLLFIEQEIERVFRIEDQEEEGEVQN